MYPAISPSGSAPAYPGTSASSHPLQRYSSSVSEPSTGSYAYQQQLPAHQCYPPMQQQPASPQQQYPPLSQQPQQPYAKQHLNGSCPYPAMQHSDGFLSQQSGQYPYHPAEPYHQQQQQQQYSPYSDSGHGRSPQRTQSLPEKQQQQQGASYDDPINRWSDQQQQPLSCPGPAQGHPYPQPQQHSDSGCFGQQQQQHQEHAPLNHQLDNLSLYSSSQPQQTLQQQQQPLPPPYPSLDRQQSPPVTTQQQQPLPRYPILDRQPTPPSPFQQQQQQQEPLPPYPKLSPSLTYKSPPESVNNGYDVLVYVTQASDLPGMDWWNGKADPYVIITTHAAGAEQDLVYKTKTVPMCLNPKFDEFFELGNLPAGSTLVVEVWDRDMVTDDDMIGRTSWQFVPKELRASACDGGEGLCGDDSWGRLPVELKLTHPVKKKLLHRHKGKIELQVCYRPSPKPGKPAMLGPVKFRQHLSPTAGALMGHWGNADTMSFSTYKLYLMNIESTFKDIRCPWNRDHDKAKTVFTNPLVMTMVCTQHNGLYATRVGATRCGVLSTAQDFFELFKGGVRAGQRRYFTFTLLEDSFRCSETGAPFFTDMMSKHAMHACGAEEVLFAGEFCIVPDESASGGHRLVLDNNSGTYAPDKKYLPLMEKLFKANFKDMVVEVLEVGNPRLKAYQKECPSRSGNN